MIGSPDLGVLSVSLTSTRSSHPSRLIGSAGPTGSRLNRMDLPCSRQAPWLHAGGKNPGSTSARSRWRGLRFRLPLSGRGSATPSTIDFGAMFPFTDVPACNPPVYASQRPLPGATQDSGQRLLARLYRDRHLRRLSSTHLQGTTRSSNRACRFPALGFPIGFTTRSTTVGRSMLVSRDDTPARDVSSPCGMSFH